MILLIFLIGIQIFPNNSQDGVAYLVGVGGAECGYVLADLALERVDMSYTGKEVTKIFVGLIASGVTQYLLRNHFEGGENNWVSVGRGHFIVVRTSISVIKGLIRKKEKKAYLDTIER